MNCWTRWKTLSVTKTDGGLVSVWRLPLDHGPHENRLLSLLEPAEQQRAQRYGNCNAVGRRNFILCRAALRLLLAERLQVNAAELRLIADDHGKPHLADHPPGVSFNVSHSQDLALIALTDGCPLGVDVEAWRANRQVAAVARRCFSAEEFARWQALAETERVPAFYALWTRKEAFAKAVGKGIAIGLECIAFDAEGGLLAVPPDCGKPGDWLVQEMDLGGGYSAAVALGDAKGRVALREFVGL